MVRIALTGPSHLLVAEQGRASWTNESLLITQGVPPR
jgi:hypothetical protein